MATHNASHSDNPSDEVLLGAIAVGDERACLTFVRRYQGRLFGLALAIVRDPSIAEEVAQEAFVRVVRHASVFDARRAPVATWVLAITRNLAIDALRVRRSVSMDPLDPVFVSLVNAGQSPEDAAIVDDALNRARILLLGLPIEQRRAVLLATIYGRTAEEIAETESIPLGTAKSRLRAGLARVRASAHTVGLS